MYVYIYIYTCSHVHIHNNVLNQNCLKNTSINSILHRKIRWVHAATIRVSTTPLAHLAPTDTALHAVALSASRA